MADKRWTIGNLTYAERMPPLPAERLNERQREVAEELTRGPRGGVKGPFIAVLRSPELVDRLGRLGEYLRFQSALPARVSEFVMLIVARQWTNQFEWAVHAPLAAKGGVAAEVITALGEGRRPHGMADDEELAYDICDELTRTRGLSDRTFEKAVAGFGEVGLIDLMSLYGYFAGICAIMNVAHTPPPAEAGVAPILPYPL